MSDFEVVGRFDVKGLPGTVQAHEADQFIPDAWGERNPQWKPLTHPQLFNSYETIDTDLPEGEYFVVRRRCT